MQCGLAGCTKAIRQIDFGRFPRYKQSPFKWFTRRARDDSDSDEDEDEDAEPASADVPTGDTPKQARTASDDYTKYLAFHVDV
ncbi:hypothetical protein CYMTET_6840 [Cymbomonas tetramitiformis]|uniref:Uncharacterized protein n=1 Tax=Cymbomonas tetramitiformis TaxID=36881 RepID=A0AAE0GWN5_9CHLO|nr:hypothetical protein CYMTET_6840 [Cymbomonas tetramitiformis]